ncbi:hypothetical protein MYCTH_2308309 [Thermothelomyces thermophilus ATCC 42464]|uniref:C2H2-type domain-containing protein n=1 Tax=Thermothelomyces thermophilus (strain ATCC 42464 / BCRC 31852 / DSM 1799) TaxID=573729 RepID=G2QJM4_THET4|nr:uncharacterized protein MYCTH_2308309 [Thermothelomyces thermophilus ATCC 42464]AEO59781.1 hypothetical protein MYCTH_2308309 [Thermothelomyces thermophilus ATCC 42464]
METAVPSDAQKPKEATIPSPGRPILPTGHTTIASVAKETLPDSSLEDPNPEGDIRESWVSFASTAASRDSAVPSLFSARASTASAATRYSVRQSVIESADSRSNLPAYAEKRKDSHPQSPRYCCTFCDAAFDTKTEWKIHEFEFHDRRERYMCRNCSAVFLRATLLAEHLEHDHGLEPTTGVSEPVEYRHIRSAWGCGFCGAGFDSRTDYLEHVGQHYDEGKEMAADWQHTRVIEGLLRQPKIAPEWLALVTKEERARGAKLRFLWDPHTTGRSTDESGPQCLQDMLEFFATGTRGANEVTVVAFSSAHVRLEDNVSDLISRLFLRDPRAKSTETSPDRIRFSPELQPSTPGMEDDVISPMSPLPAPLRSPTAPPQVPGPVPPPTGLRPQAPSIFPLPFRLAETLNSSKLSVLRHIESSRCLGPSSEATSVGSLERQALDMLPFQPSRDTPPISTQGTSESRPRHLQSTEEISWASDKRKAIIAAASLKPHTSSSTLSTHTRDSSLGFGDSTSEVLSDDSLSEPDYWVEPGGLPTATKRWRSTFQQTVDRGMARLWVRYNKHWEALVRRCVGETSTDTAHSLETSRRMRKATASRHALSKGFRTNRLMSQEEEEGEDDENDGSRPASSLSKRSSGTAKRFACPFRKHNPLIYNIHDHEVCAIRSWSTISRLKEHLYRRHYKAHCQRCKQTFSDARRLAEHEMSVVACEVLDVAPPSDITADQEKQLKSRKHTARRQTDEEKWRDIYRLLFPKEEIPSPYPEAADDMAPANSESHVNLQFHHFLLSEMPALFTRTAEEHAGRPLQAQEGLTMEAIPGIIEDALRKAFRAWEARGSDLPTREASVASMSFLPETPASLAYNFNQSTRTQQDAQPQAMEHGYSQSHYGNANFAVRASQTTTNPDDSGFADGSLFMSGPPVNFNTFAPEYGRAAWDSDFGLLGVGSYGTDVNHGTHFQGFQDS